VKVSEGCRNCYAETLITNRMGKPGLWGPAKTTDRQRTSAANWNKAIQWNRRAQKAGVVDRVFSLSLADFFEEHPQLDAIRAEAWDMIRRTPFLSWMLLTKRPENIARMLPSDWGRGWLNVGIGTSVEDMKVARRLDVLREIPALYRFVSYEPALGPLHEANLDGIHQILYGGESGPGFRPHDLAWPRAMRAVCRERGIAFFYKQGAAPRTEMFQELDGERIEEMPNYYDRAFKLHDLAVGQENGRRIYYHAANRVPDERAAVLEAMSYRVKLDRTGHVTASSKDILEGRVAPRKVTREAMELGL
jgi:protein gp37